MMLMLHDDDDDDDDDVHDEHVFLWPQFGAKEPDTLLNPILFLIPHIKTHAFFPSVAKG